MVPIASPGRALRAGVCAICACTDTAGCDAGCAWVDETRTLCSLCGDAAELAEKITEIFGAIGPRLRPPVALVIPPWATLTFDQQQVLIMACRRTAEVLTEQVLDEMSQDALGALLEVSELSKFVATHCQADIREDEGLAATVIRLLTPHVGAPLVIL